jgi:uncharacterized protein YwgA
VSQFEISAANLIEISRLKGGMLGKVDFQKTVYLAKQLGVDMPFEFRWDKLGPFSFELAHFINRLLVRNTFRIESGKYVVNTENSLAMRAESLTTIDSGTRQELDSLFRSIRRTVHQNGFHIPTFMECLGSILFIKESLENSDKKVVFESLELLKPNRAGEFSSMKEAAWNLLQRYEL